MNPPHSAPTATRVKSPRAPSLFPLLCALGLLLLLHPLTASARIHPRQKHHPQTPTLAETINAILSAPELSHAHWGISVVTEQGTPVYALNEAQFFAPASNAKLFTTAAAFAILGPNFVSKTYVTTEGKIDAQGHLAGSLRLIGTGDPSISGRTYPYDGKTERPDPPLHVLDELAATIAAAGITQINGPIIADDTFFPAQPYGPGWAWDDLEWSYGAPVAALSINDNVLYLNIFPAAKPGDPPTYSWDPALPTQGAPTPPNPEAVFYEILNTATTAAVGTPQQLGLDRSPGSNQPRLYGSLPLDSKGAHLAIAIEHPATLAANAFKEILLAHGIKASGPARAEEAMSADTRPFEDSARGPLQLRPLGTTSLPYALRPGETILATHTSPPLSVEATVINKVSQNLHAELLLRQLARSQIDPNPNPATKPSPNHTASHKPDSNPGPSPNPPVTEASFVQGVRVLRQFLVNVGVSPEDFIFYDGSGLSPSDQITPRATTTLLTYAARQPWGPAYRATLPIAGIDGTLSLRFLQSPMKGKIFAKTGTLAEVNSLSGYLTAASGKTLAFSILCNGRRPSSDAERKAIDHLTEAIAATN